MDDVNQKQASFVASGYRSGYDKMTELEISSARFDQSPGPAEGVRKFLISSTQRSGSFLLCRQLINAGIGIPQEYFNPLHIGHLCRRWKLSPQAGRDYIHELYAKRTTPNGTWGTKLQWPQYAANRLVIDDVLRDVSHYLFLYRADIAAQAVSLHVSLLTGIWGFDGTKTTQGRSDAQVGDIRHVARCAKKIAQENEEWRNFFTLRRITPLAICYEDFVADQQDSVRRIAQFLGLDDTAYRVPAPEEREDRFPPEIEAVKRDLRRRCQAHG
jgi:LPS sulfotransferase NodH